MTLLAVSGSLVAVCKTLVCCYKAILLAVGGTLVCCLWNFRLLLVEFWFTVSATVSGTITCCKYDFDLLLVRLWSDVRHTLVCCWDFDSLLLGLGLMFLRL